MTDTHALMRSLCDTKRPQLRRRKCEWQPPSATQIYLEKTLATAIKTFIMQYYRTRELQGRIESVARDRLLRIATDCLEQAVTEGHLIATGRHERGIINAAKNLAGRAVQLVSDIVDTLRAKAQDIINAVFGDSNIDDPEAVAEQELEEWAIGYSEGVAENEVQMAVNEAIVEGMQAQGIEQFDLVLDPEACQACRDRWNETPVLTAKGPFPPYHFKCRCGVDSHEE